MSLALVTDASDEPLVLEEAKHHLRLEEDFTDDDDYVTALIAAARQHVENHTGRALLTQTWRLTLDCFPCYDVIELCRPNLLTVTSVVYVDPDGANQTLSSSDYSVDTDHFPGRIILDYGLFWPATRAQRNAVTVLFTCGYGAEASTVPQPILAAMKLLIGHWYGNREAVNVGNIVNTIPIAVDALLGPYRLLEVA